MVASLPLLSCELSVSEKENPDRFDRVLNTPLKTFENLKVSNPQSKSLK